MTAVRARCAALIALLGALGACGQTGALYLPGEPTAPDGTASEAEPPPQDEDDSRRGARAQ